MYRTQYLLYIRLHTDTLIYTYTFDSIHVRFIPQNLPYVYKDILQYTHKCLLLYYYTNNINIGRITK